jgi:hypothetical protein
MATSLKKTYTKNRKHPYKHDGNRVSQFLSSINNIHREFYRDGWLCNGEVATESPYFIHGPPPFLFVDVVHPTMNDPASEGIVQVNLNFHDIQRK